MNLYRLICSKAVNCHQHFTPSLILLFCAQSKCCSNVCGKDSPFFDTTRYCFMFTQAAAQKKKSTLMKYAIRVQRYLMVRSTILSTHILVLETLYIKNFNKKSPKQQSGVIRTSKCRVPSVTRKCSIKYYQRKEKSE